MARKPKNVEQLLSADVVGSAKVRRSLNAIQAGTIDILGRKKIEDLIITRTKRRFARKGSNPLAQKDPDGVPWKEAAPSTVRKMRRKGRDPRQLLKDTGALRDSIEIIRGNLTSGIATPTGIGVRIGSNLPYARLHQLGNTEHRTPKRRFLGVGDEDVKAVEKLMQRLMIAAQARVR